MSGAMHLLDFLACLQHTSCPAKMPQVSIFLRVLLEALARNSLSTSAGTSTRRSPSPAQSVTRNGTMMPLADSAHHTLASPHQCQFEVQCEVCLALWIGPPPGGGCHEKMDRYDKVSTLYYAPPPPCTMPHLHPVLFPTSTLYWTPASLPTVPSPSQPHMPPGTAKCSSSDRLGYEACVLSGGVGSIGRGVPHSSTVDGADGWGSTMGTPLLESCRAHILGVLRQVTTCRLRTWGHPQLTMGW